MFRTFGAAALVTLACAMPLQQAAAQDPVAGGIFGGIAGGLLGGAIGGRGGAVAGAIIGGTTGAAIAAQGQRRANGYYWYNDGCYIQRPDGAWMVVAPQYCGGPVVVAPPAYGPPPVAPAAAVDDDDEVEYINPAGPGARGPRAANEEAVAACARKYRSYDPRTMTFLSNDGTRKPCP
jgi:hypothetical protein